MGAHGLTTSDCQSQDLNPSISLQSPPASSSLFLLFCLQTLNLTGTNQGQGIEAQVHQAASALKITLLSRCYKSNPGLETAPRKRNTATTSKSSPLLRALSSSPFPHKHSWCGTQCSSESGPNHFCGFLFPTALAQPSWTVKLWGRTVPWLKYYLWTQAACLPIPALQHTSWWPQAPPWALCLSFLMCNTYSIIAPTSHRSCKDYVNYSM